MTIIVSFFLHDCFSEELGCDVMWAPKKDINKWGVTAADTDPILHDILIKLSLNQRKRNFNAQLTAAVRLSSEW